MGATNVLEKANEIVHGDRNKSYGHPYDNHGLTAKYWSAYLGKDVSAIDVCFLNILQKISRTNNGIEKNLDSLVDIPGYAANIEMILDKLQDLEEPTSKTV